MKKILVNKISLLAFMLLMMGMASAQNVTFNDTNLKNALLAHDPVIDTGGDGEISYTEAEAFNGFLNLYNKSISDATGLEAFTNLTKLNIAFNSLTALDVSANTKLTYLYPYSNPLGTIDLSNNVLLDTLVLFSSQLTSIDVSNNTNLLYLDVRNNNLTSLDVTNNTALKQLSFETNNISTFTISAGLKSTLEGIGVGGNPIVSSFDFTDYASLKRLSIPSSGLTSLDVSSQTQLEWLLVMDNPITSLDLSQNTALTILYIGGTYITDIDLSQNPNLTSFNLSTPVSYLESKIKTVNLANGNNDKIESFYLSNNPDLQCIVVDNPANPFPNIVNSNYDGFTNFAEICVPGRIIFSDPEFEAALLAHDPVIDTDADGYITQDEAAAFTGTLNLRQKPIKNVGELEHFTAITGLDMYATEVGNLDLSQNTALTTLDISYVTELSVLSLDNGNNASLSITTAGSYSLLKCITVDDPTYSETNWTQLPAGIGFSTDCDVYLGDTNFKSYLIADGYDLNDDGEIQVSEAEQVTELLYSAKLIYGLWGLEAFTSLQTLELPSTVNSSAINFTQNDRLQILELPSSKLSSIDLSCNPRLIELNLSSSESSNFRTLDLTNNQQLKILYAGPYFEDIDVSQSYLLERLYVNGNELTSLDLSNHTSLVYLKLNDNNLSYLNLGNGRNDLLNTSIFNISNNPNLTCVTVDDVTYANANLTNKDSGTNYDPDCDNFIIEIPDTNLKSALLAYSPVIDSNSDGDIRLDEAEAFAGVLDVSGLSIADATGLSYFSNMTGLDISDNSLTSLNIQNGNNVNFTLFDATGNPGLSCIKVDDPIYSEENWTNVDAGVSFSYYCDSDEIVYIPDSDLRKVLLDYLLIDTSGDDKVSYGEALAFTGNLDLDQLNIHIADMTGIEAFENITGFESGRDNPISELDLSWFSQLTSLNVFQDNDGLLTSLDLSNNTLLEEIRIARIPVPNLNPSLYPNLTLLRCNTCALSTIDVSQNPLLTDLSLYNNSLSTIDLSNNTALTLLYLDYNNLDALNLTGLTALEQFSASGNNFTTLDVSAQTNLTTIELAETNVVSLDLSTNNLLERIDIYGGQDDGEGGYIYGKLKEIILPSDPTNLWYMDLVYNSIETIDLSSVYFDPTGPNFSVVYLNANDLYEVNAGNVYGLDLSQNPNLTCVKTTDVAYAEANYSFDAGVSFDPNCFSAENDILTFSFTEETDPATINNEAHEVSVEVQTGTDISSLTPTITVSDAATISPNSGTEQDFSSVFTYTVTAENSDTQDWDIYVTEKLADPTDILLSSSSIDENGTINDVVGILSAVDPSFNDSHSFDLISGDGDTDNASFTIVGNELQALEVFDFETKSSYSIRVHVGDYNYGNFEKQLTITVNDVNEAPTDIALNNNTIDESNPTGTVVGSLSTTDEDLGQSYIYTLVAGTGDTDNASFSISGSDLVSAEEFDFETKSAYSVRIMTDDGQGGTFEKEFAISINDLPAQVTAITLSSDMVNENEAAGTLVGNLSTFGEDLSGSFTYSLTAGTGDDDNASFDISGNQLVTAEAFDFESKSSYSIRVMSDDGSLTGSRMFTITVNDANDSPTDITLAGNTIAENNATGDIVGTFTSTDPDAGDSFTYNLVAGTGGDDNASFNIVNNELQAAEVFDFEAKSSYSIRVETNDGNGGTFEKSFNISITNANEGITVANPIADQTQDEGFGSLTVNLADVFEDVDGDDLTYSVSSSDAGVVTAIINAGQIQITEVGPGESSITVTAADGNGETTSDTFVMTVTPAPLGFEDALSVKIYPNPTTDFINIQSNEEMTIQLIDLNGRSLQSDSGKEVSMDVRSLNSGAYILQISNGELTETKRIIKAN